MTESPERMLLARIRQWDMLDVAADGQYWKNEIDKVLNGLEMEPNEPDLPFSGSTGD